MSKNKGMLIYSTQNTNMVIKTDSGEGSKREVKKSVLGAGERGVMKKEENIGILWLNSGQKNGYRAFNGLNGEKEAIVGFV